MVTIVMRSKAALVPPPTLQPGELALGLGSNVVRLWAGDVNGNPVEYGAGADGFIRKTGDTMSGPLVLTAVNPTSDNHAARKAYVDAQASERMRYRGTWIPGAYQKNDVVSRNGIIFVATVNTTLAPPSTDWASFSAGEVIPDPSRIDIVPAEGGITVKNAGTFPGLNIVPAVGGIKVEFS